MPLRESTLGCGIGKAASRSASDDEHRIRKLVTDLSDAWNTHDAHAFAEILAEDADFTNVLGMGAHGRKAIEEFHAPMFASNFKNSNLTPENVTIRFLSPDIASVDVGWKMTGAYRLDGTPAPLRKGLLNWVVTRSGDGWLIAVMHNQEFTLPKA